MLLYLCWLAALLLVLFPFFLHFTAWIFRVKHSKGLRSVKAAYIIVAFGLFVFAVALAMRAFGLPSSGNWLLALLFVFVGLHTVYKRMNASLPQSIGIFLLSLLLVALAEYNYSRYVSVTLTFGSLSMHPAIRLGETVIVNKLAYRSDTPDYDELIVYFEPDDQNAISLHRVHGLPGDQLTISNGRIHVNGSLVLRIAGSTVTGLDQDDVEDFGPVTVPEGHVFVLADNLELGHDSRMFGSVPLNNIVGRAEAIFWSWDDSGRMPVYKRMGRSLLPLSESQPEAPTSGQ